MEMTWRRGVGRWGRLLSILTILLASAGALLTTTQTASATTPGQVTCENSSGVITTCPTTAPGISYTPSVINFGYINNNGGSSTQSVTFTNISNQTLDLGGYGYSADGDGDSMSGIYCVGSTGDTFTLSPGQSCTATITFKIVNGVTNTTCSQTADNDCEQAWAPLFGVDQPGASTGSGFYVPFTATIGPPQTSTPSPSQGGFPPGVQAAQGCVTMPAGSVVGMAATSDDAGYWIVDSTGQVDACGDATTAYGELAFQADPPIVGMAVDPAGTGYWLVSANGEVYAFGSAVYHGGLTGVQLNKPIVGMAADPATGGYWLLGGDGGVFSFDAPFYGSTGNIVLNKPIVGMEASPSGTGYRFVASDGGIFDFGSSQFYGSAA